MTLQLLEAKGVLVPPALREALAKSDRTLWLGTISFEDRCIGSVKAAKDEKCRFGGGMAFEYRTTVHPAREDQERRAKNRSWLQRNCPDVFKTEPLFVPTDAYALHSFHKVLLDDIFLRGLDFLIIDITCLTKLHTLALASFLARRQQPFKWVISYSIPENYGTDMLVPEWRDVIIAPLAETAQLLFEDQSRGIVVTGHESGRLLVALSEIEPAGGSVIIGEMPGRPDLGNLSQRYNKNILRQFTQMRSHQWTTIKSRIFDFARIESLANSEIERAKGSKAPVILFPFGPKPLLFQLAYVMAKEYPESSWFVYPVPSAYDVNYTEGIGSSFWFADSGSID
jgi:hypothetical protein